MDRTTHQRASRLVRTTGTCIVAAFLALTGTAGAQDDDGPDVDEDTSIDEFEQQTLEGSDVELHDPYKNTLDGHPFDDLPDHIELLVDFGARPDWSPDGSTILFIDRGPLGDVWTVDVDGGEPVNVTGHLDGPGFTRAQFLSNGDIVLCGPTSGPLPTDDRPEAGRFMATMQILVAPFDGEPQTLGIPCWEAVVAADTGMRVAWNRSDIDYTASNLAERVIWGVSEIWTGTLTTDGDGDYSMGDVELAIAREAISPIAILEVKNFRPPDDDELIFTAYAYEGGQVMGVHLETGEVTDYSQSVLFDEGAGIAADGSFALVEHDMENAATPGELDIWWLSLDGEARWERLTFFNAYRDRPFYASNPAVSPDGQTMAFQLSIDEEVEGEGQGILLFDLTAVELPDPLASPDDIAALQPDADGDEADDDDGSSRSSLVWLVIALLVAGFGIGLAIVLVRRRPRGGTDP